MQLHFITSIFAEDKNCWRQVDHYNCMPRVELAITQLILRLIEFFLHVGIVNDKQTTFTMRRRFDSFDKQELSAAD